MEIAGLEMGEPTPFTTADLLADPRIPSQPGMRVLLERAQFRAVLWVPLVLDHVVVGRLGLLDHPGTDLHEGGGRLCTYAWPSKRPSRWRTRGCTRRPAGKAPRRKPLGAAVTATRLEGCVSRDALARACGILLRRYSGGLRMLQVEPWDKRKTERGLQAIERNARLQSQLVDDLHRMPRGSSPARRSRPSRIGPPAVDRGSQSNRSRRPAEEKGRPPGARRGLAAPYPVRGDRLRLYQVVVNLCVECHQVHARTRTVHVRLRRYGASARI